MAATPETCADRRECLVLRTGRCTLVVALDEQTGYFDVPKLAAHFTETGEEGFEQLVANYESRGDACLRPEALQEAAKRARARALAFFHPK